LPYLFLKSASGCHIAAGKSHTCFGVKMAEIRENSNDEGTVKRLPPLLLTPWRGE
jgi:hypothetical protein